MGADQGLVSGGAGTGGTGMVSGAPGGTSTAGYTLPPNISGVGEGSIFGYTPTAPPANPMAGYTPPTISGGPITGLMGPSYPSSMNVREAILAGAPPPPLAASPASSGAQFNAPPGHSWTEYAPGESPFGRLSPEAIAAYGTAPPTTQVTLPPTARFR